VPPREGSTGNLPADDGKKQDFRDVRSRGQNFLSEEGQRASDAELVLKISIYNKTSPLHIVLNASHSHRINRKCPY
jgi:hypothetical protein